MSVSMLQNRLLKKQECASKISIRFMGICFKLLGPCLMILTATIICLIAAASFIFILPHLDVCGFTKVIVYLIGFFLLFNILYNYVYVCITDPGCPLKVSDIWKFLEEGTVMNLSNLMYVEHNDFLHFLCSTRNEGGYRKDQINESLFIPGISIFSTYKTCKKCYSIKAPRTHHCSICNRCILKMDHHCLWINSCVGLCNYRYFVLLLLWSFLGSSMVCALSIRFIYNFIFRAIKRINESLILNLNSIIWFPSNKSCNIDYEATKLILFLFFLCLIIGCSIFFLLLLHFYLILSNQTIIEFLHSWNKEKGLRIGAMRWRSPNKFGAMKNLQNVFGSSGFPMCLFPFLDRFQGSSDKIDYLKSHLP